MTFFTTEHNFDKVLQLNNLILNETICHMQLMKHFCQWKSKNIAIKQNYLSIIICVSQIQPVTVLSRKLHV